MLITKQLWYILGWMDGGMDRWMDGGMAGWIECLVCKPFENEWKKTITYAKMGKFNP